MRGFLAATVDISPITDSLIQLGAAALTALALWIGWYVKNLIAQRVDLTHTQIDEQLQQMYNEAAARAIAYAETAVKGAVPKGVTTDHEFVVTAADYLIKFWPGLITRLDLTPAKVKDTILARLPSGEMTEKADAIVEAKAGAAAKPA